MRFEKIIKIFRTVFFQFLTFCGALMVAHIVFKLVVGRAFEIDIMMRYIVYIAGGISLSLLVFASTKPLRPAQVKKRMLVHAILFVSVAAIIYLSDVFKFSETTHPLGEGLLSFLVTMGMYALVAYLAYRQYRDKETARQMNEALARYRCNTVGKNTHTVQLDSQERN